MHRHVYNGCLLVGWLGVSTGAALVSLPLGLVAGGALLILLTLMSARVAARGAR
jgi:hypothetical protein